MVFSHCIMHYTVSEVPPDISHFFIYTVPTVTPNKVVLTQKVYGEFIRCVYMHDERVY